MSGTCSIAVVGALGAVADASSVLALLAMVGAIASTVGIWKCVAQSATQAPTPECP